ncbi:hypothetical protein FB389_1491 [Rarobacter incanus]|uniref:Uncharacterized protein n=1 Tax=Rarobacter incanus TaxID=153494 RepID=A0A542SQA4_9MICO|nr:hypothetical protein FB389_1491 [Rarobacter incanus]
MSIVLSTCALTALSILFAAGSGCAAFLWARPLPKPHRSTERDGPTLRDARRTATVITAFALGSLWRLPLPGPVWLSYVIVIVVPLCIGLTLRRRSREPLTWPRPRKR